LSDELCNLFARLFIQRKDVKAVQLSNGQYSPHTNTGKHDGERLPWTRQDLQDHIGAQRTFGHYLLDSDSNVKLFSFDVDLEKNGPNFTGRWEDSEGNWHEFDARESWKDRAHPSRPFVKLQFKDLATRLLGAIHNELDIPCAAAYTGNKGIHVYGFTGTISAHEAREAAHIVMDSVGGFQPTRGSNFFQSSIYPNFSIEIFPKQDSLDGKDLGNLMRLPLGRNLKNPSDPTFFIDMASPMGVMQPVDPIWALTTSNPFETVNA
jgi:hypothetical protein